MPNSEDNSGNRSDQANRNRPKKYIDRRAKVYGVGEHIGGERAPGISAGLMGSASLAGRKHILAQLDIIKETWAHFKAA